MIEKIKCTYQNDKLKFFFCLNNCTDKMYAYFTYGKILGQIQNIKLAVIEKNQYIYKERVTQISDVTN